MDAAEYKHVVLGLIFLKYISDSFEEHHAKLVAGKGDYEGRQPGGQGRVPRRQRVLGAEGGPLVVTSRPAPSSPASARTSTTPWSRLERDNPRLKGALNKNYGRADLDKHRLGELIDLIGSIQLGDVASRSKDLLGRVFEYFLTQFASAEGKNGGQFYTPSCVVRLLVEMLAPYKGRIYDPCLRLRRHVRAIGEIRRGSRRQARRHRVYGQESNPTTRRLAIMNLALRGIEADFRSPSTPTPFAATSTPTSAPTTCSPTRPSTTPTGSARTTTSAGSTACRPRATRTSRGCSTSSITSRPNGMAGFVLANGSMSSNQSGEGDIRRALIEADLVDCMVAMPGQLFYSTQIPVCLWFLAPKRRTTANAVTAANRRFSSTPASSAPSSTGSTAS
jgi:type I restriction enzyme M protein